MKEKIFALAIGGFVVFLASHYFAKAGVGTSPTLHFKEFGSGKPIDLSIYRGRIVVVDFWATWCGPCMAETGHIARLNRQYASRGIQVIGVSLDHDPDSLSRVIDQVGMNWPMDFEGAGWGGEAEKAWGISSIPQTFIISREGKVLWRGHPANIDGPLAEAFGDSQ
jgi:thiol-disulfide isomerase/thioredoxin